MFELVKDISGIVKIIDEIKTAEFIDLDTEGTSLDPYSNRLLLIQVKVNNKIFIIDVEATGKKSVIYFLELLNDSKTTVRGQNIKYDIKVLYTYSGELLTEIYDSFIAERLITRGIGDIYPSYADLCLKYCNVTIDKSVRNLFGDNFEGVITQEMLIYSAIDVEHLEQIYKAQYEQIVEQGQLETLELEMKLLPVTASMELEGIKLNARRWGRVARVMRCQADRIKNEIVDEVIQTTLMNGKELKKNYKNCYEVTQALKIRILTKKEKNLLEQISDISTITDYIKENFIPSSPHQLKAALNLMGISVPDTNEKTLDKFDGIPIIKKIIEYRHADKSAGSFGENWIENINPITGKIHASADQTGTVSGRYSYYAPALQQMKRENIYRHCFESDDPDFGILAVDLSQAELRQMAAICKEPKMIEAFQQGIDLHKRTASFIFQVPIEEVTKDQRQIAKNINFSLIYGISAYGLFYRYGIPVEEGEVYIARWFNEYKNVDTFIKKFGNRVWEKKMSTTLYGRKRYWKEIVLFKDNKEYYSWMGKVKREGVNHIIQGTIADVIKQAMVEIYYTNPYGDGLKMLLQVHDEIVFKVYKEIAEEAYKFVSGIMMKYQQKALGDIPAEVGEYKLQPYWSK